MDNAKNTDVVMPMFNSMEYSDDYLKTSGSLWQYYWEEPALTNDGAIKSFHVGGSSSASFKFKQKSVTAVGGTKDVEIMVQLIFK